MTEASKQKKIGYIQVYTGNGKGKTTAALGLSLRAAGHGMKTYFCQFMKKMHYGELDAVKRLNGLVTVEQHGLEEFCKPSNPPEEIHVKAAKAGLLKARTEIERGAYDIIVLDEINTAVWFGLLTEEDVLDLMSLKPPAMELVLTGRYACEKVLEKADLVTEMKEVKHYYSNGVEARTGIEL